MKKRMTILLFHSGYTGVFYPDSCMSWECEREDYVRGCPVYSAILVCPICFDVWARLDMDGQPFHEARSAPCHVHPEACHPDLRPVAGSLLDNCTCNGYDYELLAALPEPLLRREFSLTMSSLLTKEIT